MYRIEIIQMFALQHTIANTIYSKSLHNQFTSPKEGFAEHSLVA